MIARGSVAVLSPLSFRYRRGFPARGRYAADRASGIWVDPSTTISIPVPGTTVVICSAARSMAPVAASSKVVGRVLPGRNPGDGAMDQGTLWRHLFANGVGIFWRIATARRATYRVGSTSTPLALPLRTGYRRHYPSSSEFGLRELLDSREYERRMPSIVPDITCRPARSGPCWQETDFLQPHIPTLNSSS